MVIIILESFAAEYVGALNNGQGYTPFYGAADPWSYSTDYVVANMPATFDGAITTTATCATPPTRPSPPP